MQTLGKTYLFILTPIFSRPIVEVGKTYLFILTPIFSRPIVEVGKTYLFILTPIFSRPIVEVHGSRPMANIIYKEFSGNKDENKFLISTKLLIET